MRRSVRPDLCLPVMEEEARLKEAKTTTTTTTRPARSPSPESHAPMSHTFACHAPASHLPEPLPYAEDRGGAVWAGLRQDPMVTPFPLQLVKKVVQSGDTACLQSILAVFCHEDRQLLWGHCHARALAILRARPGGAEGGAHTREAIAYLSLAIFASGKSLPAPSSHPHPARYLGLRGACAMWRRGVVRHQRSEHMLGSQVFHDSWSPSC